MNFFLCLFSRREARHLQLQIDQIASKDMSVFGLQDRIRPAKSRTPKCKLRRSPYPHIAENPEYIGDYQEKDFEADLDLVTPLQGCQGLGLPTPILTHANDSLDRYTAMCSAYQSAPDYKDFKDCAYPYLTPNHFDTGQFRHESRYPLRDQHFHNSPNGSDNPKLNETLQLTPVTCDFRPNGQCSRSSSRDPSFGTPLSHHGPFSNRSESSVSDVDVVDEYEGRPLAVKTVDKKQSDSLLEHNTNTMNSEHIQSDSNPQTENVQQSVIMRMSNNHAYNNSSPRYSCDYSQSKLSKSPCAVQTDLSKVQFQSQNNSSYYYEGNPLDSANKYLEIKPVPGKGLSCNDDALLQCLQNGYQYSSFNQGTSYSAPGLQNKYPVIPQAGYTSVIVDTQQYMSNGFVH